MNQPPPIRVIVSSRVPSIRTGLRELLERGGFEVADDQDASDALFDVDSDEFDVAMIDLGDDAELRRALRGELADVPAVLLSDRAEAGDAALAARAWLLPDAGADALTAAVAAVASGLTVYASELAPSGDVGGLDADVGSEAVSITDRERDVLALLATGLPNKGIARRLDISEHTVKFHVGSLLSKLDAQSRTEAVTIAARQGLLTL